MSPQDFTLTLALSFKGEGMFMRRGDIIVIL